MPSFDGVLTDAQIVALVNYVRAHFTTEPMWESPDRTLADIRNNKGGS
jgi:mono/diheme cytochrome c family protein